MALRAVALRLGAKRAPFRRGIQVRSFSDGKVLSDEERAAETMYIKKMEKEKLEKAARQGVKPEESGATAEPGSTPVTETSTDSTKNIAVFAGVVALLAAGWWYFSSNTKAAEKEKE